MNRIIVIIFINSALPKISTTTSSSLSLPIADISSNELPYESEIKVDESPHESETNE